MTPTELLSCARASVRAALEQCRWRNATAPATRAELDRKHQWFVGFARDRRPAARGPLSWDTEIDRVWTAALAEHAGELAAIDEPQQLSLFAGR